MPRLVSIRHLELGHGRSAVAPDASSGSRQGGKPPPPWTSLDGRARGDDGRTYAWSIVTTAALGDPFDGDGDAWRGLCEVAGVRLWLDEREPPVVIVDAPHFGPELLDALQYGPAWLRAQVFYPLLTEAEQEWLDGLEQRDADALVPRVVAALEAELGVPLWVDADRAVWAAQIMLEEGYVISPVHLFSTCGELFSSSARALVTSWLAEHAPD